MAGGLRLISAMLCVVFVAVLTTGCRRLPHKAAQLTGEEFFQQGRSALKQGDLALAADLFAKSLALDDDWQLRQTAAMELLGAGRADLATGLLAGRSELHLRSLSAAIAIAAKFPPPGHEDNPYVAAPMADALTIAGVGGELVERGF